MGTQTECKYEIALTKIALHQQYANSDLSKMKGMPKTYEFVADDVHVVVVDKSAKLSGVITSTW